MIYELFLEGELADIRQDLGMQLNFNIDDINKYGSRDTSFSKTIVLPGTAKNNKLLGFVGELGSFNTYAGGAANIGSNFNPAQTTKAELRANGLLLLKGVFRLTGIVKDRDMIEYEGNLFGELGGFIAAIGRGKLEELDFNAYNHTYTYNNIVNSWNTVNGSGYYYPLIDYGTYSSQKVDYDYRTFRPALYVKEYIDKIFDGSEYTYESSFLNSAFFKKLIIPNNTANLKTFSSRGLNVATIAYTETSDKTILFNNYIFLGNFTTSNGKNFTYQGLTSFKPIVNLSLIDIQISTSINIRTFIRFCFVIKKGSNVIFYGSNGLTGSILNNYDFLIEAERRSLSIDGGQTVDFVGSQLLFEDWPFTVNPLNNTSIIISGTSNNDGQYTITTVDEANKRLILNRSFPINDFDSDFSVNYQPETRSSLIYLSNFKINNVVINDEISSGTEIYIFAQTTSGIVDIKSLNNLEINSQNPILNNVSLNDLIFMKETIPKNILQKDFFTWILKMFNLYVTEDKLKEKHLLIEPYKDYYDLTESVDWTYKVSRDKPWQVKPMGFLNSRFFEYKYKEDNDFYNENFKKKYNQPYGTILQDANFQFAKDKQTIEIGFSPTVLIQYDGISQKTKVLPAIYKKSKGNSLDQEERMDSNIRILMAKKITSDVANWNIVNTGGSQIFPGTSIGASLTVYGYAGHFDDPVNPTVDINFGACGEIYFDPVTYPTNNLFNDYWSGYIAEIADKDSKLLTCHVYLTELDIAQLDFSKPVFIDGVLWRINKIMDFDASSGELTKVELLKVINNG